MGSSQIEDKSLLDMLGVLYHTILQNFTMQFFFLYFTVESVNKVESHNAISQPVLELLAIQ